MLAQGPPTSSVRILDGLKNEDIMIITQRIGSKNAHVIRFMHGSATAGAKLPTVLQSYNTDVAVFMPNLALFITEVKYSRTTTRHISFFTCEIAARNGTAPAIVVVPQEEIDTWVEKLTDEYK